MPKEMISGIASGPACPPVVLGSKCTFPAHCLSPWGAAVEEGSPEINLFSSQAGDWEGVLFSRHYKRLPTSYDTEP